MYITLPLERQNVRRDAVQKPAVVADDHYAAGKIQDRFFQRPQRVDIQVVSGLIQQQQVGAAPQQLGQMHAVPFSA